MSEYHEHGTLHDSPDRFKGDVGAALHAFRGLVSGVAELHNENIVHRDIKPQNVFLGQDGSLVLGDFGLVFFEDPEKSRLSGTFENVGTRDWMPPWALSLRIDEVKPTFDVFSLGKLLWSMISGEPVLQLWYFAETRFNVEELFPKARYMALANSLLEKCVVEQEEDCLPSAAELLAEVDSVLRTIEVGGDVIDSSVQRTCRVCGRGEYSLKINHDAHPTAFQNFGLRPAGKQTFKVFVCTNCHHVQLFSATAKRPPPAWAPKWEVE